MSMPPEIKSDEDWKARVRAENQQLDSQQKAESPDVDSSDSPLPPRRGQFPKPDFSTLVGMFSTQAMVALGLIPNPEDGQPEVQLDLARHFIDLLGVLEEKTQSQLTETERRLLEQSLHELRMAYLQLSRGS